VHTFVYWLQYLILTSILFFPGTVYEDISANTSMDSPRKPSAPGWAIR